MFNTLIIYEHYDQSIYFYNYSNHKEYIKLTNNNYNLIFNIIRNNNFKC